MTTEEQSAIFRKWMEQYPRLIFKVIRAYAPTAMDQEDLFQDIALQIWRSVPAFRNECAITTWIYRISLNTAIKWTRQEKKRRQVSEVENFSLIADEHGDERLAWLYQQIQKLNDADRSIALLLLDDLSYKDIAAITGITEGNVAVKIHRIKQQLITQSKKIRHEL